MSTETLLEAPVFTPTMEEFSNFSKYLESISETWKEAGICKVIPPPEWNRGFTYEGIETMVIPHPIKQYVTGTKGIYQLLLVESKRIAVEDFQAKAEEEKIPKSNKYKNECGSEDIDRIFWRNLKFNPPIYGADMVGSLMKDDVSAWNLNHLDSILQVMKEDMPGITAPYLYFGMWKAMFAWHVEDMNLFSINYLHFGEPKTWYTIPPKHAGRFELLAQNLFPDMHKNCPEFLRHKTTLISPYVIARHNMELRRTVQKKGEIILTWPYAYHCGFNHGFNCAESVNFALESWIDYGMKANHCKCEVDSVRIDMEIFLERYNAWKEGKLDLNTFKIDYPQQLKGRKRRKTIAAEDLLPEECRNPKKPKAAGAEESNEDSSPKKKKRITARQLKVLQKALISHNLEIPEKDEREKLAQQLDWSPQGIYNWFRRHCLPKPGSSSVPNSESTTTTTSVPVVKGKLSQKLQPKKLFEPTKRGRKPKAKIQSPTRVLTRIRPEKISKTLLGSKTTLKKKLASKAKSKTKPSPVSSPKVQTSSTPTRATPKLKWTLRSSTNAAS